MPMKKRFVAALLILLAVVLGIYGIDEEEGGRWCPWSSWGGWRTESIWPEDEHIEPCPVGSLFAHKSRQCHFNCTGYNCTIGHEERTKECQNHWYCAEQYCESTDNNQTGYECIICANSTSYWNDTCPGESDPLIKCQKCPDYDDVYGQDAYCIRDGKCEPRCNWLDHMCWPGTCDKPIYLATSCQCSDGFILDESDNKIMCALNTAPTMNTCNMGASDNSGLMVNASNYAPTTYIRIQPHLISLHFTTVFEQPLGLPSASQGHAYIFDDCFGLVDASVDLQYQLRSGETMNISSNVIQNATCIADETISKEDPLTTPLVCHYEYPWLYGAFEEGERICQTFNMVASGYVLVLDLFNQSTLSDKRFHNEVNTTQTLCLHTDFSPPYHCIATNTPSPCDLDTIDVGSRTKRTFNFDAIADGWLDTDTNSNASTPSGIGQYRMIIYRAFVTFGEILIDTSSKVDEIISTNKQIHVSLPTHLEVQMYGLYLFVHDRAQPGGHYESTRRMVLVDTISDIQISSLHQLRVTSADVDTNYEWQIHHGVISVSWVGRYHNDWHIHTNYLHPIRRDPTIDSIYDQNNGKLPIAGTPNIDGVVNFQFAYHRKTNDIISEDYQNVPDFQNQKLDSLGLFTQDGDDIDIFIKALDIMDNIFIETVNVKVDASVPLISRLYVEGQDFRMVVFDLHSGIVAIDWIIEDLSTFQEIGKGSIDSNELTKECASEKHDCYCPIIGNCQQNVYAVSLKHISGIDRQNQTKYHFDVKVINGAGLESEDDMQDYAGFLDDVFPTALVAGVTSVLLIIIIVVVVIGVIVIRRKRKPIPTSHSQPEDECDSLNKMHSAEQLKIEQASLHNVYESQDDGTYDNQDLEEYIYEMPTTPERKRPKEYTSMLIAHINPGYDGTNDWDTEEETVSPYYNDEEIYSEIG